MLVPPAWLAYHLALFFVEALLLVHAWTRHILSPSGEAASLPWPDPAVLYWGFSCLTASQGTWQAWEVPLLHVRPSTISWAGFAACAFHPAHCACNSTSMSSQFLVFKGFCAGYPLQYLFYWFMNILKHIPLGIIESHLLIKKSGNHQMPIDCSFITCRLFWRYNL